MGQAPLGSADYGAIPVPAARDEQPPQANGARDRRHTYPPPETLGLSIFWMSTVPATVTFPSNIC